MIERAGEELAGPPWRTLADAAGAWSGIWHSKAIAHDGHWLKWERAVARLVDDNPGSGSDGLDPPSA